LERTNKKSQKKVENLKNKSLSSNPIEKIINQLEKGALSEEKKHQNPYAEDAINKEKKSRKTLKPSQNPFIDKANFKDIVETINSFNVSKSKSKSYVTPISDISDISDANLNYAEIMKSVSDAFQNNTSIINLYSQLNNIFVEKLKWNFIGLAYFMKNQNV